MGIDQDIVRLTPEFKQYLQSKPSVSLGGNNPEIFPFTRLIWRDYKNKEKYSKIQQTIQRVEWETEHEMVKRGYRHCNVYQLDPEQYDYQINKVSEEGLVFLSILRSKRYQGFGHRHYPVDTLDSNSFIYGVVADTLENAQQFRDAHLAKTTDHKKIGELLGYPDCCTEWFTEVWLNYGCVDPMYETAINTEGVRWDPEKDTAVVRGNPKFNRLIRYWGLQCIPYFTHSYSCKKSEDFIEKFYGIMHEKAPEEVETLLEWLNMPCRWSLNNLLVEVKHPLFTGVANGYYWPRKLTVEWKGEN